MALTTDKASAQPLLLPELTNVVLTAPIEQGRHKLPAGAAGSKDMVKPEQQAGSNGLDK